MRRLLPLGLVLAACAVPPAPPARDPAVLVHEPLDAADERWRGVVAVADGARGGCAHFDGERAHIDVGPCPVDAWQPFTLRCRIRTTASGFCTPLMARAGDAVGISLVLGREPGRLSFEAWSWGSVRIGSLFRIDDGQWHDVEVPYDPASNLAALIVDGHLQGTAELGPGGSPHAVLRLGDNIGAHQPFAGDLDEVVVLGSTQRRDVLAALAPVLPIAEREAALRGLRRLVLPMFTPGLGETAAAQWPARRTAVRAHVADCLGLSPPPPVLPLDVQVHGQLVRDGVRLQRVSWVGFPGQRATGWLWLPEPLPAGPLPAVLNPHGHWQDGARHLVVQARCASFAKFGWVALAVDSVHVEHVASGVNSIGAMTWHNQRALDVLLARTEVDPDRIACTGASGGGQQTYYLMALEDRLAAAAPMVMACYFAEIVDDLSAHCGCNHLPRLAAGTDVPELCAVFAPRPAMFGSVGGDWTRNFPDAGLPELTAHWLRLGGPPPRSRHAADEGHNYDQPMREQVYGFLTAVLQDQPASGAATTRSEPPFGPFLAAELHPLLRARPNAALDAAAMAAEHLRRRPRVASLAALAPGLDMRPPRPRARGSRGWLPTGPAGHATVAANDGVPIPVRWPAADAAVGPDGCVMRRYFGPEPTPFTVVVDPRGSAALLAEQPAWLAGLALPLLVDPRPYGEWARFRSAWQRNGILLGRGEGYQAALDVATVCASLPGEQPVHVVGLGEAGVVALLAAHLCPRIGRIVTDDLGPTYAENGNRWPLCPELLRFCDLPELIATLPSGCAYELGGALRNGATSSDPGLSAPFSPAELTARLARRAR